MRFAFAGSVGAVLLAACPPPGGGFRQAPGGVDPVATRYINPGTLAAIPGFTHAVRVGMTVYVSGEVALDSLGRLVGPGDVKAQGVATLPRDGLLIAVDATAVVRAMFRPLDERDRRNRP